MPMLPIIQNGFNQGELGDFMEGRADLKVYRSAARRIENWIVLPQGALLRRPGFEFIYELSGITDGDQVRLARFDFNKEQQYVLCFTPDTLLIIRNKQLAATVSGIGYSANDLRDLRMAQSGDTLIVVHPDYPPRRLVRQGSDTSWVFEDIPFENLSFFRFNTSVTATPSATTGSITLTLAAGGYVWNAGHSDSIDIKINGGEVETTGFPNNATGGTAYSSAGTAAQAFDGNNATDCLAGTDGWIGYDFTTDTTIRVIGIRHTADTTLSLVFETDDNSGFSSPTVVGSATVITEASDMVYVTVPLHQGEQFFRIRETGGADLDVEELIFNRGLVVNATVGTTLSNTNASNDFTEQSWGEHHGYPRTVGFLGNRLIFGGLLDEPATIFGSRDGDLFNFDDTSTDDDYAIKRTISSDQNHFIRDIRADREGMVILTSDGEFHMNGNGDAITANNVAIDPQSRVGASNIPMTEVDGILIFAAANKKEILTIGYSFADNKYVLDSKTTLAHHLFKDGQFPRAMAALRSFKDTQASLLFVPREDGEMAVLSLDTAKEVLAWSRFTTDGDFKDVVVVETEHDASVGPIPTGYVIVERVIDGNTKVFLEALTEQEVYLDHWYTGTDTAKTDWTGLTTLPNTEITVIGDGFVQGSFTVDGSGGFSLANAVETIFAGLPYTSTMETMKLPVISGDRIIRGKAVTAKEAVVDLYDTMAMSINGYPIRFRQFGAGLLDTTVTGFTGQKRVKISNNRSGMGSGSLRDPTLTVTVSDPVQATLLTLTGEVKVGS